MKMEQKNPTNRCGDYIVTEYVISGIGGEVIRVHRWNKNGKGWDKELEGY